jgi:hypothetical protein
MGRKGKWTPTIPNYPPVVGRPAAEKTPRRRHHHNYCFFFVSSRAFTVTMVPKIWSKPRPTRRSAHPVSANCVKGLASRCDLCVL